MRIAGDPQSKQVLNSLITAAVGNRSFPNKASEYLSNLEIQKVRRVQRLMARVDSLVDQCPGPCLQKPIDRGRRVENYHRASRSSRTMRPVSMGAKIGSRWCRRSLISANVGRSAISLISDSK